MLRIAFLLIAACLALPTAAQAQHFHELLAPGSPISGTFVTGPTVPGKWGSATMGTSGGVVTWSIMGPGISFPGESGAPGLSVDLSTIFPIGYMAELQAAFDQWEAIADIDFVFVTDGGGAFNAEPVGMIRVGAHAFDGSGGTLAHGFFPPVNGAFAAGDIHFDSAETWKLSFGGPGFDIQQVMAHEIGHAIGLDHTAVPSSLMNPFYTEAFAGVQADDIAGAQFIYGAAPFDAETVPEPASLCLWALGSMLAIGWGYRRVRIPGARSMADSSP